MPKIFTSEKQKIGETGENVAVKFLMKHGFYVLERNYTKKWGEIDVIARNNEKLHFVEVKSVTVRELPNVKHETPDQYRPEDNMHPWKLKRLSRTIQTYLLSHKEFDNTEWQVDLLVVYLDLENRQARVKLMADIII